MNAGSKITSKTAVGPWHLKVKKYDITISIRNITSIHKFILKIRQILRAHEI